MTEGFLSYIRQHVKSQTGFISLMLAALFWIMIAVQTDRFLGPRLYIGLKEAIVSRIWLIGLFFIGRYLLFPRIRNRNLLQWSFVLFFFLIIGLRITQTVHHTVNWLYFVLLFGDILFSSLFLAGLSETIGGVFQYWRLVSNDAIKVVDECRCELFHDVFKLGLLLMMFMCLAEYYLINFCLVDTGLYSYFLAVTVVAGGCSLYAVAFTKIRNLFQHEINEIDLKLASYLYEQSRDSRDLAEILPRYQFLLITRNYFNELKKPFVSIKVIIWYLLFCGFILVLPYLCGGIIEV